MLRLFINFPSKSLHYCFGLLFIEICRPPQESLEWTPEQR